VHEAVAELLDKGRGGELTVAEVADRSGVHATTIYRRWRSIEALILDVAVAQVVSGFPVPDTGSLRGDLEAYATQAARNLSSRTGAAFLRTLVAALPSTPETRAQRGEFLAERGKELQAIVDRALARGERAPSLDDILEGILAPLYFRVLADSRPVDDAYALSLVDRLLA